MQKVRLRNMSSGGYSLLEMLVVLLLFFIMGSFALPNLASLNRTFKHMNVQADWVKDLKRAQAESITQGCRGVLVVPSDGRSYSFGCDYLEYDINNPPSHDGASFVRKLPEHVKITVTTPIIFNSRGQAIDVNYIVANATINFMDTSQGVNTFATGTLLGTGVFTFD